MPIKTLIPISELYFVVLAGEDVCKLAPVIALGLSESGKEVYPIAPYDGGFKIFTEECQDDEEYLGLIHGRTMEQIQEEVSKINQERLNAELVK